VHLPGPTEKIRRREFLLGAGALCGLEMGGSLLHSSERARVAIVPDDTFEGTGASCVRRAMKELARAFEENQIATIVSDAPCHVEDAAAYIAVGARDSELRRGFGQLQVPTERESLTLAPGKLWGKPAFLVDGADERGLLYAALELAARVRSYGWAALMTTQTTVEQPLNQIRSMSRAFVSEVEDKGWYHDKQFWREYLAELAASRINRFSFNFGIGYNFPRNVTGDYFHFPYPYLLDVPGYKVRAVPLSDSERDQNLETLKFITEETKAHGLQCQLGLWTHAYQWTDSPHSDHHIEGLNASNHAAYSRDALALLLKNCPAIEGITLRVHGESGIPEGSYDFWSTLFEAVKKAGRKVEIDMHAKGLDARMIGIAVDTGMPVKVSPKFWAEHLGLGYHQAAIRELEMPRQEDDKETVFKLSNGARRFLRSGYGDLFQQGRKYDVLFRIWPGTQKMLLWGDPALAAGIGNSSHFCGAAGVDIFEPLFFKGREGSGLPGGRCAYLDESLNPKEGDWAKFRYTYRVWGRYLYNPKADEAETRTALTPDFGPAAPHVETAVAKASRILPLWTTAHLPSASNNSFWPELYSNMPIVAGSSREPYGDTPEPKRFGTVSSLDPELFLSIREHATDLLSGKVNAKYSPLEVAAWTETLASAADTSLRRARADAKSASSPEFRRMEEDVLIMSGLGHFFAHKLRSGVFFELFLETKDRGSLEAAILEYEKARASWELMSSRAAKIYRKDITFGSRPVERGHWADRLPDIDKDLTAMKALLSGAVSGSGSAQAAKALTIVKAPAVRPAFKVAHQPPPTFRRGEAMAVSATIAASAKRENVAMILHYRHVNQAERWQQTAMSGQRDSYRAEISGSYTQSAYSLQYYFEIQTGDGKATLSPGFNTDLNNQPYYVIQSS
jgi:hypothetical protein